MYIRKTKCIDKLGRPVTYLHLAQSYRDPVTQTPKTRLLASLGRIDVQGRTSLRQLAQSIDRLLQNSAQVS